MNKHIELVKKWLADPSSVSSEELKANFNAADAAAYAASAAADAAYAASVANAANAANAKYWVKCYEDLEKETDA